MTRLITSMTVITFLVGLAGCNRPASREMQKSSQNLMAISKAYRKATQKLGMPPTNLDMMSAELKELGDPEILLVSPEDNERYVILFGANADANPAQVVAYEKNGKDGKRFVLFGHIVWYLTDEELRSKPFPPGKKAPS